MFFIFYNGKRCYCYYYIKVASIHYLSLLIVHTRSRRGCACAVNTLNKSTQGWEVETQNRWQVNGESLIILILKHSQVIWLHSTDWPKCFTKLDNVKKTCQQQRRKYTEAETKTKAVSHASIGQVLWDVTLRQLIETIKSFKGNGTLLVWGVKTEQISKY